MRQSRRAPVLAAAGLVCVALVTLLSIVGNDRAAPRRLVLADPTAVSAMTGDGSDTWRQNVADMWSRSQLSGVPQPSSSRSSSTVPTLVLNMPMQVAHQAPALRKRAAKIPLLVSCATFTHTGPRTRGGGHMIRIRTR
jgi:hypothetical protein